MVHEDFSSPPRYLLQYPFDDLKLVEANWTKSCVLIMKGLPEAYKPLCHMVLLLVISFYSVFRETNELLSKNLMGNAVYFTHWLTSHVTFMLISSIGLIINSNDQLRK